MEKLLKEQECIPVGCVLWVAVAVSGGVSAQRGVCPGDVCPGVCVCLGTGDCLGRVSAWGVYTSPHCGQTDACENITFPQLDGNKKNAEETQLKWLHFL